MHPLLTFCIAFFCTIYSAYTQYSGVPGSVLCAPGMRYDDRQWMCVSCGINKFLYGGQTGVCINCPAGTMSPEISWTISHCICNHGYGGSGSQQGCSICGLAANNALTIKQFFQVVQKTKNQDVVNLFREYIFHVFLLNDINIYKCM